MFNFRSLFFVLAIVSLCLPTGCNPGPTATESLAAKFSKMKKFSLEFEDHLASVVDLETAEEYYPKLDVTIEAMIAAGKVLAVAEQTKSRTAIVLKKEIKEFRLDQGKRIKLHVKRLNALPGVEEVLKPIFARMGNDFKPITEQN